MQRHPTLAERPSLARFVYAALALVTALLAAGAAIGVAVLIDALYR